MQGKKLTYGYAVTECDVEDQRQLPLFRTKMSEWHELLFGDDLHSIWPQIHSMLWDAALFRTVNDLHRIAEEQPESDVGFNPAVRLLGFAGVSPVPVPQYDHLANLDKAWVDRSGSARMRELWRNNVAAIEAWQSDRKWSPLDAVEES